MTQDMGGAEYPIDAGPAVEGSRERGRKHRSKRKRRSRKQEKMLHNLAWLGSGLAVGLPLMAAMLFAMR